MNELHAIYAYLETGVRVRVSPAMSWGNAVRVFHGVPLWAGGLADREEVYVGDYIGRVRHFCVRSIDDPEWPSGQPPHDVETLQERRERTADELATALASERLYLVGA
jgi:hypothetical protein